MVLHFCSIAKEATMERDNDTVELGSVSTDTLGNFGPAIEVGGKELSAGISID